MIYEMCTGMELADLIPLEEEYMLVPDDASQALLRYVFQQREGGTFKHAIRKVRIMEDQRHHKMSKFPSWWFPLGLLEC